MKLERKSEMELRSKVSELIFKETLLTLEELETVYPPRELPNEAKVTRIAPSPTGFMHIGGIYTGLISRRLAHESGGVYYLRIEDTDLKRTVEGAEEVIFSGLNLYGISPDEGRLDSLGKYGPYKQSERKAIYSSAVKRMILDGSAYVCFSTAEEISEMRIAQQSQSVRTGYYGRWAVWRDAPISEVISRLSENSPFVVRLKSQGDHNHRMKYEDVILGTKILPENDLDIVIMKQDGLPTYHMAHVVDDHFMRTNLVVRGDEWVSSVPVHIELFKILGWDVPDYAHLAPIQKMDGTSKRKLSKRKDPEANVMYFDKSGYPPASVVEYLTNLANSSFEVWRESNPDLGIDDYKLDLSQLKHASGALFDSEKLESVSRNHISRLTSANVYDESTAWAKRNDRELESVLTKNPEYSKAIFALERDGVSKKRKDLARWAEIKEQYDFFFTEYFKPEYKVRIANLGGAAAQKASEIVRTFSKVYDFKDGPDVWLEKLRENARKLGFASTTKEFKKSPDAYLGSMPSYANVLRIAITGKDKSPDLYSVMLLLGSDEVSRRFENFLETIEN
jgi:glutamyl-tRNA synthetase